MQVVALINLVCFLVSINAFIVNRNNPSSQPWLGGFFLLTILSGVVCSAMVVLGSL